MNASNKSEHEKIVRCKSNEKMRDCAYNKRTELEPKSHTQCKSRVGAPGHATVAPSFSTDSSGHPSQVTRPPLILIAKFVSTHLSGTQSIFFSCPERTAGSSLQTQSSSRLNGTQRCTQKTNSIYIYS
jgi:hypothetical protein